MKALFSSLVVLATMAPTFVFADCGADGAPGKVYANCPPMEGARPVGQTSPSSNYGGAANPQQTGGQQSGSNGQTQKKPAQTSSGGGYHVPVVEAGPTPK
jgi:hypothetical protein